MARQPRTTDAPDAALDAADSAQTDVTVEPTLEGMPEATPDSEASDDDAAERVKVPKQLRPLFNEIGRLSGILGLARKAVYDDRPERAVKALMLLESQAPAAREIAELSTP